jgi:hypothetical protein
MLARSASVVAGVMRSTMVQGKLTLPIQIARLGVHLVGKRHNGRFGQLAVAGQVVATEHGKGRQAGSLRRRLEGLHDQAQNGFGCPRVGQVGLDGGCLQLQFAGGRVKVVALSR